MQTFLAGAAIGAAFFAMAQRAEALPNVGAEIGVSQRAVDWVEPLLAGFAFGLHAEMDLGPLVRLGPYYLHYELPSDDRYIYFPEEGAWFASGTFNTVGLRSRFFLPLAGSLKPYLVAGFGYTWLRYQLGRVRNYGGHFVELPIGAGLAYEVNEKWSISLDAAYRPAVLFGGQTFEGDGHNASTGTSFLLGVSFSP